MSGNQEGTPNPLNPGANAGGASRPASFAVTPGMDTASFGGASKYNGASSFDGGVAPKVAAASGPMTGGRVLDPMMRPSNHMASEAPAAPTPEAPAPKTPTPETPAQITPPGGFSSEAAMETLMNEPTQTNYNENLVAHDSIVEPAGGKKSKKGLFTILFSLFMIAVICGVAAAIILMNQGGAGGDKVSAAINKFFNNSSAMNINANGNIDVDSSTFNASVKLDLFANTSDKMQKASATATVSIAGSDSWEIDIEEARTKNGDVYLKFGNLANALGEMMPNLLGLMQTVDNQWLYVPNTTSGTDFTESIDTMGFFNNSSACLTNVLLDLPSYTKDLGSKYQQNPFVTYSTDNLKITKKKNSLYKLGIDEDKLTGFVNSLSNSSLANALNACSGGQATNTKISTAEISQIFNGFPTIYVEIDDNDNFTRVYFDASVDDGTSVKADLSLSYPSKFEVVEPSEYLNLNDMLSQFFTAMFSPYSITTDCVGDSENCIDIESGSSWYVIDDDDSILDDTNY